MSADYPTLKFAAAMQLAVFFLLTLQKHYLPSPSLGQTAATFSFKTMWHFHGSFSNDIMAVKGLKGQNQILSHH